MTNYTVIVKGENKTASNLFDVLNIIKKLEGQGKEVYVFSSSPQESKSFKQWVRNIYQ